MGRKIGGQENKADEFVLFNRLQTKYPYQQTVCYQHKDFTARKHKKTWMSNRRQQEEYSVTFDKKDTGHNFPLIDGNF